MKTRYRKLTYRQFRKAALNYKIGHVSGVWGPLDMHEKALGAIAMLERLGAITVEHLQRGNVRFTVVRQITEDDLPKDTKTKGQCKYPQCLKPGEHRHHIVYRPAVVVNLCRGHHEDITVCNINAVENKTFRRRLSNNERWYIWNQWLNGNITPVRTENALAWIAKWDKEKPARNMAGFPPDAFLH